MRLQFSIAIQLFVLANSISVNMIPETGTPPSYREIPGMVVNTVDNKLYMYGGRYDSILGDMWEFDLTANRWEEIYFKSMISPGPRSSPHLVHLEKEGKILLFGGSTESGPVSDLWIFDIENQSVKHIQWKVIDEKGRPPPRAYYRCTTSYEYEGNKYLAICGGLGKSMNPITSLYM